MTGLPTLGYRMTAHDGPLGFCGGDGQATAPAEVSLRHYSTVSDIGALSPIDVVPPNRKSQHRHNIVTKLV